MCICLYLQFICGTRYTGPYMQKEAMKKHLPQAGCPTFRISWLCILNSLTYVWSRNRRKFLCRHVGPYVLPTGRHLSPLKGLPNLIWYRRFYRSKAVNNERIGQSDALLEVPMSTQKGQGCLPSSTFDRSSRCNTVDYQICAPLFISHSHANYVGLFGE